MTPMRFLLFAAGFSLCAGLSGCSDDGDSWVTVDGKAPALELESTLIGARTGSSFSIKGKVTDADGLQCIKLRCPALYLDKTINLLAIYGEPLTSYDLDYSVPVDAKEAGDIFRIEVTAVDVAGNTAVSTVTVDLDGDVDAPVFAVAPPSDAMVVLADGKAVLSLSFTVKDDRELASVSVDIDEVDFHDEITAFEPAGECAYKRDIELPARVAEYNLTVKAADTWNNCSEAAVTVRVSDTPDYPKMWLADVKTAAELNSDVMGVPMLIERTAPYTYEGAYYNEKAGTEVYFLPQRTDFLPVRIGIDPADESSLSTDAAASKPFVLDREKVYYHFVLNLLEKSYTIDTYGVDVAIDPVPHAFGSMEMDFHQDGQTFVEFWFGYMTDGPASVSRFVQDADNPHLYRLASPVALRAGRHSGFIIHNYHSDGWWNYCTWRADDEQEPETVDYYGNYTNPLWHGKRGEDKWFKPAIPADGNYQLIFDAHLGRARIVPAN